MPKDKELKKAPPIPPQAAMPRKWVDSYKLLRPQQKAFLMGFAQLGSISLCAEQQGISRQSHYDWLGEKTPNGEEYNKAYAEAQDRMVDALLMTAEGKALAGDGDMIKFLLRSLDRARFGDKAQVEHSGGATFTVITGVPPADEEKKP